MEDDAGQYRTVAGKVNPGNDEAHRNGAYEEVDYKPGINHE